MAIAIRPAAQADLDVLWDFLAIAAHAADRAAAERIPVVAAHLAGGSICMIRAGQDNAAGSPIERRSG